MPINGITVRVSDGIKTADYAPPKLYDLTANISLTDGEDVDVVLVDTLKRLAAHGDRFLGRTAVATVTRKPKETAAPAADPLVSAAPATSEDPLASPPAASAIVEPPAADPGLADLLPATEKDITDDEIVHAVMKKNEALKDATKIRALIESYNPQPGLRVFKATEVTQADRPGFLAKLDALTT